MTTHKKYSQEELNKTLWSAADSSRSSVDAGVYKDYALTMLFLKYISDLNKKRYTEYKERFKNDEKRVEVEEQAKPTHVRSRSLRTSKRRSSKCPLPVRL